MHSELDNIRNRYKKRSIETDPRYDIFLPSHFLSRQEKERALIHLLRNECDTLGNKTLIEIGCGSGSNLLQLISFGFKPANLAANELLVERLEAAKQKLSSSVNFMPGDASTLPIPDNSYNIVYQSTVFSSILDDAFQANLANAMWKWVKPGGGILWYDFLYNNPKNPDVRGVPLSRIRMLFPSASIITKHITLAPPISRAITKIHPVLYPLFNALPFLRTHVLCYIKKTS